MVYISRREDSNMNNLREKLYEIADEEYRKFHSGLCPNVENIIGVRLPKLREIAKRIAKDNPIQFLEQYKCELYEEKMVYGLVIGYMKENFSTRLKYLDKFVPMIDNWAVCDCCASTYKFTSKNLKEMFEYIQKYVVSKNEFEVRFACIMLMDYYLIDEYIDRVFKIFNEIKLDKYYVQMGIAWAISVAFVKYEKKTRKFLENNSLDKFTFNKTLQKIIESNRVSKDVKVEMREMKNTSSLKNKHEL